MRVCIYSIIHLYMYWLALSNVAFFDILGAAVEHLHTIFDDSSLSKAVNFSHELVKKHNLVLLIFTLLIAYSVGLYICILCMTPMLGISIISSIFAFISLFDNHKSMEVLNYNLLLKGSDGYLLE